MTVMSSDEACENDHHSDVKRSMSKPHENSIKVKKKKSILWWNQMTFLKPAIFFILMSILMAP